MRSPLQTAAYRAFLDRLRAARERSGLAPHEAARRLNKPEHYVAQCEAGKRRVDAIEAVEFARLYGLTLTELLIGPVGDHP
jgi:ribosome-binding protein aMBF1 (putative translation factor)